MTTLAQTQFCTIILGVYGDNDREPSILMGTCWGIQHVPELARHLRAAMDARLGVRDRMDYFWDGRSEWKDEPREGA